MPSRIVAFIVSSLFGSGFLLEILRRGPRAFQIGKPLNREFVIVHNYHFWSIKNQISYKTYFAIKKLKEK